MKSLTYLKKSHEFPLRIFSDVPWILQKSWMDTVEEALYTVLSANWDFGQNINDEDLDNYIDVGDFLFNHEVDD